MTLSIHKDIMQPLQHLSISGIKQKNAPFLEFHNKITLVWKN